MAKSGDRVRFLNATGGGIITRIEGKTVYVEDEDGFESPYLLKDVVVVLPAGHEAAVKGSSVMFDQKAYDAGKSQAATAVSKEVSVGKEMPATAAEASKKEPPVEETRHGDSPTLLLAFEPDDAKKLGSTRFVAVLVNDSNYYLDFAFSRRSEGGRGWDLVFSGSVAPNELIDLAVLTHEDLPGFERVALQCIAYKRDKNFSLVPPVNVNRRLDLTKFHKFHCFRESKYFDRPVLEFPLLTGGLEVREPDPSEIREALKNFQSDKALNKELAGKYKSDTGKKSSRIQNPADNPYKKLPLIEVDLHIGELMDSTSGMQPKDMLEFQLDTVRKTMAAHSRRSGQKIVFIHGKGEGVLRKAVVDMLKKEYPKATLQDASFREYGFGATLVTI